MKTLMIDVRDRPTPYAYQVPEPVYEKFKHIESAIIPSENFPSLLEFINQTCDDHRRELMEIELYDRHEVARDSMKTIFETIKE